MNTSDLHTLLSFPELVSSENTVLLEQISNEFPYFQAVRAIALKSLYKQKSIKYNTELKKTAAYTTDRDILFEFIISNSFVGYNSTELEKEKTVSQCEFEKTIVESPNNTLVESILTTIDNGGEKTLDEQENSTVSELEEKLEIGKPLSFSSEEKHSFQEWLQLSKTSPINRQNEDFDQNKEEILDVEKQKKLELIDKFIEANPKIIAKKNIPASTANIEFSEKDNSHIMTETLAKIYLEQKKYQKAIQAYEILILKYPEKSSFFADQILDIKALQQHNN